MHKLDGKVLATLISLASPLQTLSIVLPVSSTESLVMAETTGISIWLTGIWNGESRNINLQNIKLFPGRVVAAAMDRTYGQTWYRGRDYASLLNHGLTVACVSPCCRGNLWRTSIRYGLASRCRGSTRLTRAVKSMPMPSSLGDFPVVT